MAREIEYWLKRKFRQSNWPSKNHEPVHKYIDLSGNNHSTGDLIAVPITATVLPQKADLGTVGWLYFENKDSTNFVRIGAGDSWTASGAPIKISAGQVGWFEWSGAQTVSASADSGTVNLYWEAYEA